jgi:hypothetical protein
MGVLIADRGFQIADFGRNKFGGTKVPGFPQIQ